MRRQRWVTTGVHELPSSNSWTSIVARRYLHLPVSVFVPAVLSSLAVVICCVSCCCDCCGLPSSNCSSRSSADSSWGSRWRRPVNWARPGRTRWRADEGNYHRSPSPLMLWTNNVTSLNRNAYYAAVPYEAALRLTPVRLSVFRAHRRHC